MQILPTRPARWALGFWLAMGAAGALAACGSSGTRPTPANPVSNNNPSVTQPAATTPPTTVPSGGGVSY